MKGSDSQSTFQGASLQAIPWGSYKASRVGGSPDATRLPPAGALYRSDCFLCHQLRGKLALDYLRIHSPGTKGFCDLRQYRVWLCCLKVIR